MGIIVSLVLRNLLIATACFILPAIGTCCAQIPRASSPVATENSLVLQSETASDQLAVQLPVTLVYESSSWVVKLADILVDDWKAKWVVDEGKIDSLLAAIAAELDGDNPAPKLGPNDYLIGTGGFRLDREAAKAALRETPNAGARAINLKVDEIPARVGKLLQSAPAGGGVLYLTFDDAMNLASEIMAVAESYGARVTFFPIGDTVIVNPAIAAAAVQRGHSVQTHGYSHIAHKGKSLEWQINNIQQGVDATYAATGVRPTLFRPPFGSYDENTKIAAAAVGVGMILWSVSSSDSVHTVSSEQIRINVLSRSKNGSVVLMHAWNGNTLSALPKIIAAAKEQGYSVISLR